MRRLQGNRGSCREGMSDHFSTSLADLNLENMQVGFKSFLNITPNVTHSAAPPASPRPNSTSSQPSAAAAVGSSFTLTFDENPLAEFVELPEDALEGGLWFSNVLCGVLRGSLEMVRTLLSVASLRTNRQIFILRFKCKFKQNLYRTC